MMEAGITPEDVKSLDDLKRLPYTNKKDLRDNYPFGLFTVPKKELVRIHASSGTTGKPTVVGYTKNDLKTWTECVSRIAALGGATEEDVAQICFGYGMFTGALGLHYGLENLGATVCPTSSGNTQKQIMYMQDFDDVSVPERYQAKFGWVSYKVMILPYVKSPGVYQCPSQSFLLGKGDTLFDGTNIHDMEKPKQLGGYAVSRVHYENDALPTAGDGKGYPEATYAAPSNAIWLVESKQKTAADFDGDGYASLWIGQGYKKGQTFIRGKTGEKESGRGGTPNLKDTGGIRHSGGSTYGFLDGHTHWYRPEQIPCNDNECWWSRPGHH
jgi:prepilin-type processing-associated H-X9-DG protein